MIKHNFPSNMTVICNKKLNYKQTLEIFTLAIAAGIPIWNTTITTPVDSEYPFIEYCHDLFPHNTITYGITQRKDLGDLGRDEIVVSHAEFKNLLVGKGTPITQFEETFTLNSEYSAKVTKHGIVVGCQQFTHEKINQLHQLSLKAQKSKY